MEPTPLEAQQAALREVRARYERGELTSESFERALDALLLAHDAEECAAVIAALPPPSHPLAALAALDAAQQPVAVPPAQPATKRIVAFMSQTKKMRRPWRLAPKLRASALMGEVKLDLRLAELPPHSELQLTAIMGNIELYVPRAVRVTVRSSVYLSDVDALGEHTSGVVAFGHEDHEPPQGATPAPQLDVEVFALMGSVRVVLVDERGVTVRELVRDAVQAAATSFARGLRDGATSQQLLTSGGDARNA